MTQERIHEPRNGKTYDLWEHELSYPHYVAFRRWPIAQFVIDWERNDRDTEYVPYVTVTKVLLRDIDGTETDITALLNADIVRDDVSDYAITNADEFRG